MISEKGNERFLSLPEDTLGLFLVGCADVSIGVVNTETASVVVGANCVVFAGIISVVALLSSVTELFDTRFGVGVSSLMLVGWMVVIMAFDLVVGVVTVK